MSNKFNQYSSGGESNVIDGSLDIYGYTLRADNLQPNEPIKSNAIGQLISSQLDISDVNNLQIELDATIQNPNNSVLVTDGLTITSGNILKTDEIHESTLGTNINLANDLYTNNVIVTGGNEIKTNNIGEASVGAGMSILSNIDLNSKIISNVNEIKVDSIDSKAGALSVSFPSNLNSQDIICDNIREKTLLGGVNILSNVDMNAKDIQNCELIAVDNIQSKNLIDDIVCGSNLDMFVKNIKNVNDITTSSVLCDNIKEKTVAGGINILNNVDMNLKTLNNVNNLQTTTISATDGVAINLLDNINAGLYDIENINEIKTNIISTNTTGDVNLLSNLDLNNRDILNISSMTITATQYISKIADLPTPVADFYIIPDNTTWIIIGQLTLQYGIQYGVNCSLRGIDFSSTIEFDESARNCSIKVVDNNFYLSQISIVNGGGRFSLSGRGLLDAQNYNLAAAAPFYGRNKRFKVTDCNILRPWKIGTVEGFGTLNVTNNFFNGGGGLAAQPEAYYTNDGLSVSDGLSLEFNNNKMVLMLGAQQVSTAKLLNMKARVSPLLGFNAVTITGNIFHPRGTETGIDFNDDSRTELGNISGNVFIRTGGSSPLINYSDQTLYDNYNPISIENSSESTTSVNPSRTAIVPTFNDQIIKIDSSARFAIQLDCSGVTVPFVAFERIQYGNNPAFHTAYIMAVEPEAGGLQTIYVTDMSTSPLQIPNPVAGWTSPSGGACSSALYQYRWRYSEKDPRKLITVATFTISTANNEEYFVAPGNGVADASCEVSGVANASGVGGTVSLSCSRTYSEGDIVNFFLSSAGGSATSIVKGIINIK
jgi:hypothetical protein